MDTVDTVDTTGSVDSTVGIESSGTVETLKSASTDLQGRAHKIWLAGLGALASAGDESSKLFNSLVEKGEKMEKRGLGQVDKVKAKVDNATGKARSRAGKTLDEVETRVDRVVGSALQRVGVPSRQEIATLTRRVEELTEAVSRLQPKRNSSSKKDSATTH
jgi:poly(hydroxyalkanoate) granule-associated protein